MPWGDDRLTPRGLDAPQVLFRREARMGDCSQVSVLRDISQTWGQGSLQPAEW